MSGAEKVLLQLIDHALSEGDTVTLASPAGAITEGLDPRIDHIAIEHQVPNANPGSTRARKPGSNAAVPLTWLRTARVLAPAMRAADVVLLNSTFGLPAVALAKQRAKVPVVWLVHDTIAKRKQEIAACLGARAVDVAIAVSEPTAERIRPYYRNVVVRPNGVVLPDAEFFARRGAAQGHDQGRPVVGMLAAITDWKAQDVLIDAVSLIDPAVLDIEVELAGAVFPGSQVYADSLHDRVDARGVANRVRFLGHVNPDDVFARWDLLVSPSRLPEAGPLGVLEAMAHKVPVIATNLGGSADYLRDGRGLLIPPDDAEALAQALQQFFADPSTAQRMSETGYEAVMREHDLSRTIPNMLEVLRGAAR
ncbi:glycosyltransferase family 4 protein [Corynebacterium sanguinis]|uniref:glycosyltransferase family 4 protein n=1 Tax=Corynebacterium sanguinis TaxID=2594913 RepID=UPI0014784292|nr:glycosyltransferase family 4 protein [Corynebacterium sanguinis]MCT1597293.1 glycosyltransferase family 4 protein [Corynebacterium sanguinis]